MPKVASYNQKVDEKVISKISQMAVAGTQAEHSSLLHMSSVSERLALQSRTNTYFKVKENLRLRI